MWVLVVFAPGNHAWAEFVGPVFKHEANASAGRPSPGTTEVLEYYGSILRL